MNKKVSSESVVKDIRRRKENDTTANRESTRTRKELETNH